MKNRLCLLILLFLTHLTIGQKALPVPKPNSPPGLPIDSDVVWLFVLGCIVGVVAYNLKPEKQ